MWLVNKESGERFLIAKYYPATGWYIWDDQEFLKKASAAFNKDDFGSDVWPNEGKEPVRKDAISRHGNFGGQPWALEYEDSGTF